ncbi:MAG: UDP-glucose 4-epimerase GalE [Polyangiaceae bacterium]|nr:UDP-glucose 4-epimerase GalE [Polyangiaceae bacterium]
MCVLVTGGAGYVGSHLVRRLMRAGRSVVILDDLSTGHREALPARVPFYLGDVADAHLVRRIVSEHSVRSIVHFAGRIQVAESMRDPRLYYAGNLTATMALLDAALDAGVRTFVSSSSAAVYGTPVDVPIGEDADTRPISPYGETKLAVERLLASYSRAYGLLYAALRYFNAAGAEPGLGERHVPESHLIPRVLDVALGKSPRVVVHGDDYPTPDGTCIRDYVHVVDLADGHLAALDYLAAGGESGVFNLGTGRGRSVREVISMCRAVTGKEIPVSWGPRREGDPPSLVASPRLAQVRFRWRAECSSLDRIVRDAWAWHRCKEERPHAR